MGATSVRKRSGEVLNEVTGACKADERSCTHGEEKDLANMFFIPTIGEERCVNSKVEKKEARPAKRTHEDVDACKKGERNCTRDGRKWPESRQTVAFFRVRYLSINLAYLYTRLGAKKSFFTDKHCTLDFQI